MKCPAVDECGVTGVGASLVVHPTIVGASRQQSIAIRMGERMTGKDKFGNLAVSAPSMLLFNRGK